MYKSCSGAIRAYIIGNTCKRHGRLARWHKWRACDVGEAHYPTLPLLQLRHSPFSKPFFHFSYVTWGAAYGKRFPEFRNKHANNINKVASLLTEQSSFSNLSVTSPTSQLILQPCRRFTYVTAHYPTLPLLHLRYSSFFKPLFRFSYVTGSSLTSPGEPPISRGSLNSEIIMPIK